MPVQQINLEKLSSCYQNWEKMKSCEGGRLCKGCDKVIVDFRKMKAHEIAMTHALSAEPVCGIYAKRNKAIGMESRLSSKGAKKWVLGLFTLASLSQYPEIVKADEPRIIQLIGDERVDNKTETQTSNVIADSIIINGIVYSDDRGSLNPIPFANVFIKGTEKGCNTDFEGRFSLAFDAEMFTGDSITLVVQYIGHSKQEKIIPKKTQQVDMILKSDIEMVAFGVQVLPPRKRFWRWLTAPFTKRY